MPVYAILKQDINSQSFTQEQFNLEKYNIFKRGTIKEFIKGMVKEISKRLPKDSKLVDLKEDAKEKVNESFRIVLQLRGSTRVFIITDINYGSKVAYKLLDKCFERKDYDVLIKEYKDWENKDLLKQAEDELEKCNVIVMESLSQILQRGETLSDLVEKSENLSMQTKILFKAAKKKNSCC